MLYNIHVNEIERQFVGHAEQYLLLVFVDCSVVKVDMHPTEDLFLSTSLDRHMRMWDMKSGACVV